MAVYDPAYMNRLPEWLAELVRTTGLVNATAFLEAQILTQPGIIPSVYTYYIAIMAGAHP